MAGFNASLSAADSISVQIPASTNALGGKRSFTSGEFMVIGLAELQKASQAGVRRYKVVPVPVLGDCRIQSLFESEMRSIRESLVDKKGELIRSRASKLNALLIGRCLVGDDNARLLTDEDVLKGALDGLDGGSVTFLFNECKQFSGFAADDDWKAIEDATKNSESTTAN